MSAEIVIGEEKGLALTGYRVSGIRESNTRPLTSRSREVRSPDCEEEIL
jgi:hypothetical protein